MFIPFNDLYKRDGRAGRDADGDGKVEEKAAPKKGGRKKDLPKMSAAELRAVYRDAAKSGEEVIFRSAPGDVSDIKQRNYGGVHFSQVRRTANGYAIHQDVDQTKKAKNGQVGVFTVPKDQLADLDGPEVREFTRRRSINEVRETVGDAPKGSAERAKAAKKIRAIREGYRGPGGYGTQAFRDSLWESYEPTPEFVEHMKSKGYKGIRNSGMYTSYGEYKRVPQRVLFDTDTLKFLGRNAIKPFAKLHELDALAKALDRFVSFDEIYKAR